MTSAENNIEFLIAKATDPYGADANLKVENICKVCAKIDEDFEGPFVAMKLLSYKMLSPNQQEAFNSLEVMDAVINRGGLRCANELGKYKFLNQFIRLLSPKYQGSQTSDNVKKKATELLYAWTQSFRHLDKLQQVYNSLKKEKIIECDPILDPSQIPRLTTREQRVCAMGDEEKEKLLSQLLKSRKPEDLQTANRMIKSMVRTEENKFESERKRTELIETARTKSGLLNDLMDAAELDRRSADITLMYDLFESLITQRPKLFHLAAEAAERSDERMAEILALNDDLNQIIQRYKGGYEEFVNAGREKTEGKRKDETYNEPCLIDSFANNYDHVEQLVNHVGAIDIRQHKLDTPQASCSATKPDPQSESYIDTNLLDFSCPSTSYNTYEGKNNSQTDDLESILMNAGQCNGNKPQTNLSLKEDDNFLLKDVHINLDEIDFLPIEPIVFCEQPIVKGLIYFIKPKSPMNNSIISTLATLAFTSTQPLNNVTFFLSTKSPIVTYRNIDGQKHTIHALNPLKPTPTVNQLFLLLPLAGNTSNVEVEYQLSSESFNYTGTFTLPLPK